MNHQVMQKVTAMGKRITLKTQGNKNKKNYYNFIDEGQKKQLHSCNTSKQHIYTPKWDSLVGYIYSFAKGTT